MRIFKIDNLDIIQNKNHYNNYCLYCVGGRNQRLCESLQSLTDSECDKTKLGYRLATKKEIRKISKNNIIAKKATT